MPFPETQKERRPFIGTISQFKKFIPNFTKTGAAMNELIKKKTSNKLNWNDKLLAFLS